MWLIYLLATVTGSLFGVLANRFIYDWAWFAEYSLSPWSRRPTLYTVRPIHRIPLIGCFAIGNLRGKTLYPTELEKASDEEKSLIPVLGRFAMLRPAMVELACLVGVPLLTWWYLDGGWTGLASTEQWPGGQTTLWIQLTLHTALLWLMLIAALIDWDERTIPDQVTVSGLIAGILVLTIWPDARLPELQYSGLSLESVTPLHLMSPDRPADWYFAGWTLAVPLACWLFWALLVVPKTIDWRYGPRRGLRILCASIWRPGRKHPAAETRRRPVPTTTWITFLVAVAGTILSIWAWSQGGTIWESHLTMVWSMALAGLGTWLVRVLASMTVGDEALGFGDVTLMFMMGAAFGWQFALLTFVMGPLLSLGYAVGNLLITGEQKLAFGPWLCAGATLCLIFWHRVWEVASDGLFGIGAVTLLAIITVCLGLLPPLLWVLMKLKQMAGYA